MIILSANKITKAYGTDVILQDVSFHMNEGDKVGLIGDNGAGKTTLMNILAGETAATSGDFFVGRDVEIGFLKQKDYFDPQKTVMEEVEAIFSGVAALGDEIEKLTAEVAAKSEAGAPEDEIERLLHRLDDLQVEFKNRGGYSYKSEMVGVLSSMAFGSEYYDKRIGTLSGGESTRLALACLLLKKPGLLFLDEPTNHLDIGTLTWLEQYLKSYTGSILLISHDRYFLDRTVNRIFEIENHKLTAYNTNYSGYAAEKQKAREIQLKKYEKQQEEISRQEEIIRRFKQHNTEHLVKRAQSREKMLEHMERIEKPEALRGKIKINFKQAVQSGNDVLLGEDLAKGFGYGAEKKELFRGVNFDIKRGERVCIVGANGIGKTTLLRIMMKDLEPDSGRLKVGYNVEFGYYDQGQLLLNNANTLLDELHESYRLYSDTEMRSILGRFLFKNDMVFQTVGSLSGGEKARLSLLKLMLGEANVLVLDEPTNHLDISSKEVFEEALQDFPGTVIVVSHDRYFLNRIPDRILELTKDGLVEYLGKYDYYHEKKESVGSGKAYLSQLGGARGDEKPSTGAAEDRKAKKALEAEERRRSRELEACEREIAEYEEKIAELEAGIAAPGNATDHLKLSELGEEIVKYKGLLDSVYEKWLTLQG